MNSVLNTDVCQTAIDQLDDLREFNANFEALRIASGPHLPISLRPWKFGKREYVLDDDGPQYVEFDGNGNDD